MPGIKKQFRVRPGVRHERLDVFHRLDYRAHVVMIGQVYALAAAVCGDGFDIGAEPEPVGRRELRPIAQRDVSLSVDGAGGLAHDAD